MNNLLVVPQIEPLPRLTVSTEALQKKSQLIDRSLAVVVVANESARDLAIQVASDIRAQLKLVEAARVEVKEPFMRVANDIDAVARDYRALLTSEAARLSALVGTFEDGRQKALQDEEETVEQERLRLAQEATKDAPPDATAQDRAAALDRAAVAEEGIDAANAKIAELRAAKLSSKPIGGMLRRDWIIQVTDINALREAHPQCVDITVKLMAVKDLLKAGIIPAGVTARPTATFAARATK